MLKTLKQSKPRKKTISIMTNKITVLGLVAATAFIFTSCTKDNDTSLNDRLIAPVASIDAPTLNDGSLLKGGFESEEANEGIFTPSLETAPVSVPAQLLKGGFESEEAEENLPVPTPPIWNNLDRYQKSLGIKGSYSDDPEPIEPIIPEPFGTPLEVLYNAERLINGSGFPDCTFPVIGKQNTGKSDL